MLLKNTWLVAFFLELFFLAKSTSVNDFVAIPISI